MVEEGNMSPPLRASKFCRPSNTTKCQVELRPSVGKATSSRATALPVVWTSILVLRKLNLISGALILLDCISTRRKIVVEVRARRDIEKVILEVDEIVALNLAVLFDNNTNKVFGGVLPFQEGRFESAQSIHLRQASLPPTLDRDKVEWRFPKAGVLVQADTIVSVDDPKSRQSFYYQIISCNGDGNSDEVVLCQKSTHFFLEAPLQSTSPRLPQMSLNETLRDWPTTVESVETLHQHPDSMKLLRAFHSVPPTSSPDERILHIVGTQDEHHLEYSVTTAAAMSGRQTIAVSGLASYAFFSGIKVSSGGIQDKLAGLDRALENSLRCAPSILLLNNLDEEFARDDEPLRQDEEGRCWSLLLEKLSWTSYAPTPSKLLQVPSVLVVITTIKPLRAGRLLDELSSKSLYASFPDAQYIIFLWSSVHLIHRDKLVASLEGRPAHDVVQIRELFVRDMKGNAFHDPMTLFESLCALKDESGRRKSGLGRIPCVKWEDVGGLDHVRREIRDTIELPLKYPHYFQQGRSGILLYGPPGTGKTMVAKAVATECKLPFLSIKGPELLGSYVGESEAHIRGVFENARELASKNKPPACILFFDELDSLAPRRGEQASGGNVMDRVVASLFSELDRRTSGSTVFCLGATNRPELLDPALLRPGRFDRMVYLGIFPHDRTRILSTQLRKLRLEDKLEIVVPQLIQRLPLNLTGADLSTIPTGALMRATERLCSKADAELLRAKEAGMDAIVLDDILDSWNDDDLTPIVTLSDLFEAASAVVPSVSAEALAEYERLHEEFSSLSMSIPTEK